MAAPWASIFFLAFFFFFFLAEKLVGAG